MANPKEMLETEIDEVDEADLPDDVLESIEDTDDDLGDETQSNELRTAEEGMEQTDFIDPRGEDEHEEDADGPA